MAENIQFYNLNTYRNYPFKNTKVLPLIDFSLEVPTDTTGCYISSIQYNYLIVSTQDGVPYAVGFNIHQLSTPIYLYKVIDPSAIITEVNKLPDAIGHIILSNYLEYPVEYEMASTELLEDTWFREVSDSIRKIYFKNRSGQYRKLKENIVFIQGENFKIDQTDTSITFSAINIPEVGNYLKNIHVDGEVTIGSHISIYGGTIVKIAGSVFGTAIYSPHLACPIVFEPGLAGEPGDPGSPGLDGLPGLNITAAFYIPEICIYDPCYCIPEEIDENCYGNYNTWCDPPVEIEIPEMPEIPDWPIIDGTLPEFEVPTVDIGVPTLPIPTPPEPPPPEPPDPDILEDFDEDPTYSFLGYRGPYISQIPLAAAGPLDEDYTVIQAIEEVWEGSEPDDYILGYIDGYDMGYGTGYDDGYNDCYFCSFDDSCFGSPDYEMGYQDAYSEAYDDGFMDGINDFIWMEEYGFSYGMSYDPEYTGGGELTVSHIPYSLAPFLVPDKEYAIKFSNIELDDASVISLYFGFGFSAEECITYIGNGCVGFNSPHGKSANVFQYALDQDKNKVFIYDTIEVLTEDWSLVGSDEIYLEEIESPEGIIWGSEQPYTKHVFGKRTYIVWEDGTKKEIVNILDEYINHDLYGYYYELYGYVGEWGDERRVGVTLYNVTDETKLPEMPFIISTRDILENALSEHPSYRISFYRMDSPLGRLGLPCVDGVMPPLYDNSGTLEEWYYSRNYIWGHTTSDTLTSKYIPHHNKISFYYNLDTDNSRIKVYRYTYFGEDSIYNLQWNISGLLNISDYFMDLVDFLDVPVLASSKTETYTDRVMLEAEQCYTVNDGLIFGRNEGLHTLAFLREKISETVSIDRVHYFIDITNCCAEDRRPTNILRFIQDVCQPYSTKQTIVSYFNNYFLDVNGQPYTHPTKITGFSYNEEATLRVKMFESISNIESGQEFLISSDLALSGSDVYIHSPYTGSGMDTFFEKSPGYDMFDPDKIFFSQVTQDDPPLQTQIVSLDTTGGLYESPVFRHNQANISKLPYIFKDNTATVSVSDKGTLNVYTRKRLNRGNGAHDYVFAVEGDDAPHWGDGGGPYDNYVIFTYTRTYPYQNGRWYAFASFQPDIYSTIYYPVEQEPPLPTLYHPVAESPDVWQGVRAYLGPDNYYNPNGTYTLMYPTNAVTTGSHAGLEAIPGTPYTLTLSGVSLMNNIFSLLPHKTLGDNITQDYIITGKPPENNSSIKQEDLSNVTLTGIGFRGIYENATNFIIEGDILSNPDYYSGGEWAIADDFKYGTFTTPGTLVPGFDNLGSVIRFSLNSAYVVETPGGIIGKYVPIPPYPADREGKAYLLKRIKYTIAGKEYTQVLYNVSLGSIEYQARYKYLSIWDPDDGSYLVFQVHLAGDFPRLFCAYTPYPAPGRTQKPMEEKWLHCHVRYNIERSWQGFPPVYLECIDGGLWYTSSWEP